MKGLLHVEHISYIYFVQAPSGLLLVKLEAIVHGFFIIPLKFSPKTLLSLIEHGLHKRFDLLDHDSIHSLGFF